MASDKQPVDTSAPTPFKATPQMSQHTFLWCLLRRGLYAGFGDIFGFLSQHGWAMSFLSPTRDSSFY